MFMAVTAAFSAADTISVDAKYNKDFYLNQVTVPPPPGAAPAIFAGAQIQTWSGDPTAQGTITYKAGGPMATYEHAAANSAQTRVINGGLPINATGLNVTQAYAPGQISINDGHNNANSATASIQVDPLRAVGPAVDIRVPGQPINRMVLTNSVHVNINGTADAGTVNDKHGHHSADSFAAVEINGARQAFTQTAGSRPGWDQRARLRILLL
jgi:hypothetical protein